MRRARIAYGGGIHNATVDKDATSLTLRRLSSVTPSAEAARTVDLLHLALAIGFITVAIPIRLDAHWITMGWFVEAAALLWVADRIHSELLNAFAVGALALGVGRLLLFDNFAVSTPIFNARMSTYTTAIAVLGGTAWYGSRHWGFDLATTGDHNLAVDRTRVRQGPVASRSCVCDNKAEGGYRCRDRGRARQPRNALSCRGG